MAVQVRVINSSLTKALTTRILSNLPRVDFTLENLRQLLCAETQDRWVCISGSNFAYVVSRGENQGVGLCAAAFGGTGKVSSVTYTQRYTFISASFDSKKLHLVRDDLNLPSLTTEVAQAVSRIPDSLDLAKEVKGLANAHKKSFWHVIAGSKFSFSLTNEELEGPLVLHYGDMKVLLFRQQGSKRSINWKGMGTWLLNVFLVTVIFVTLITMVKCTSESTSWICSHQYPLQCTALSIIIYRIWKRFLPTRFKSGKTK